MQIFIHCKTTRHVSGVTAPFIMSIKNCNRSLPYRSYYLYRYSPPAWSDRDGANQFTYVKKLNTAVKIDTEAIANLSNIIKDNMIQSHENFQRVARDMLWLNITLFVQSELHTVIGQLEFTLFQLVQQIDDLFNIIQCAMHGRLSIKLLNPSVLQNILRNVTLRLLDGRQKFVSESRSDHVGWE